MAEGKDFIKHMFQLPTFKKWAIMSAACLMPSIHALAQQSQDEIERELNPIVVTATGTHARQHNAAGDVQVVSREMLQASHVSTMEEALVLLAPGLSVMTNGMGTTLSLNGLSDDYILVLENGRRISGEDRLTRINLASIKRIEVLNGGASTLYGSDAIAGVINIITESSGSRSLDTDNDVEVSARNYSQISSKGRLTESITAGIRAGRFLSNTALQYRQADNYQVNDHELVYDQLKPTGRVMSQGYKNYTLDQRFAWNFDNGLQVYIRGNYNNYHTQRPQKATYYKGSTKKTAGVTDTLFTETAAYSYDLARENYLYGAGASWRVNQKVYLEADFFADNLISERDSFDTYREGGRQLTKETHLYNANVKGIISLSPRNKFVAGLEMMHETYASYNFEGKSMNTFSAYAQYEHQLLAQLRAIVGGRFVHNQYFGAYGTPNVQLVYAPGDFRIRAGFSQGFRSPTLVQIHYENDETKTITIGNKDLKPEKSNFFHLSASYMAHGVQVGVKGFYNKVRDMISYRTLTNNEVTERGLDTRYPTATKYQQRDNINEAYVAGVTANISCYLPLGFSLGGSYTYQHSNAKSITLNASTQTYDEKSEPVDRSVAHSANVHAQWNHTWMKYTLAVRLQGHIQGERWSTSYGYAPAFSQFDLHTNHTWRLNNTQLEAGLGIENIFNTRDTRPWCSNFSTLHPGRCVMASFAVSI